MSILNRVSPHWPAVLLTLGLAICTTGVANGEFRHGVLWYTDVQDQSRITTAAQRYEIGVTGKAYPANKVAIKNLNPDFKWFVYNSATDNYVLQGTDTEEHDLMVSMAQQRGWDPEECYMHYYDDTIITIQGETITIPGWGGGSATDPSQARVPVYYKNLSRRVVNFSNPRAIQLHKEVWINLAFDTPFEGTTLYPDGIFLDNSASSLFNYGIISSGGHVLEAPGHPLIGSPDYQDWHWNENYGPFLTALHDTLETSASWSRDGNRKYLMMNIANIWSDGYVSRDATDYFFMEFEYNPVRNFGLNAIDEAFRRDRLAADAGMTCFYAATMTSKVSGRPDEYNRADVMLGNLAWYLMTRTERTVFYEFGTASPHVAGWDTLTWRGCIDAIDTHLGEAWDEPHTFAEGIDPLGNPYVVKARTYQGGLVLVRNRGEWNQGIEPGTAITIDLPTALKRMDPDGNLGPDITSISLRNGQAAVLVAEWLVPVELLSFRAEHSHQGAIVEWEIASEPSGFAGFHLYRENEFGEREQLTTQLLSGSRTYQFVDENPADWSTRYWLSEVSRSGEVSWAGSVVLEPASATRTTLQLIQNHPNPFRAATSIQFETAAPGRTVVRVIGITGRVVARLRDSELPAGRHEVTWNGLDHLGRRVAPGIYFYRLDTPNGSLTRKLTLLP